MKRLEDQVHAIGTLTGFVQGYPHEAGQRRDAGIQGTGREVVELIFN